MSRRVTANTLVCAGNHPTPLAISVYRYDRINKAVRSVQVMRVFRLLSCGDCGIILHTYEN